MAVRFFKGFKAASDFAKKLASEHKTTVKLGRRENDFYVEIPRSMDTSIKDDVVEYEPKYYHDQYSNTDVQYRDTDDYDSQETEREIREELLDYAESMARSEKDGWFYPDREGFLEENISDEE